MGEGDGGVGGLRPMEDLPGEEEGAGAVGDLAGSGKGWVRAEVEEVSVEK